MTMSPSPEYLDKLRLYFEEEVEGEAYFIEAARAYDDPIIREKLELLAAVERHAAASIAPLLEKHGIRLQRRVAKLQALGRADARRMPANWNFFLARMHRTYPGFVARFQELEVLGPEDDRQRLNFLTQHEMAAMELLRLEAVDPAGSAEPLKEYLAEDPSCWVVRVW